MSRFEAYLWSYTPVGQQINTPGVLDRLGVLNNYLQHARNEAAHAATVLRQLFIAAAAGDTYYGAYLLFLDQNLSQSSSRQKKVMLHPGH